MDKIIKSASYSGAKKLKLHHPEKKIEEFQKQLQAQYWYQKHRRVRKNFSRNQVIACRVDYQWQADLADLQTLAKFNNNYRYILTVIDVVSRFAWSKPLKNKTASSVTNAMEEILKEGRVPVKLQTDLGTEFFNTTFQHLMKTYEITHFSTAADCKSSIVERFNLTLKTKMWKYFADYDTYIYIDVLSYFLSSYNSTIHRTIDMAPKDVTIKNDHLVLRKMYGCYWNKNKKLIIFKFKIDDYVRIPQYKTVFSKGYEGNWTDEVFIIAECLPRNPPVYKIKDQQNECVKGTYYEHELQKVAFDSNKDMIIEKIVKSKKINGVPHVLVSWKGYPSKFNSWIEKSSMK
jgi:hypothetical protein